MILFAIMKEKREKGSSWVTSKTNSISMYFICTDVTTIWCGAYHGCYRSSHRMLSSAVDIPENWVQVSLIFALYQHAGVGKQCLGMVLVTTFPCTPNNRGNSLCNTKISVANEAGNSHWFAGCSPKQTWTSKLPVALWDQKAAFLEGSVVTWEVSQS